MAEKVRYIRVCANCLQASCWLNDLSCDRARRAGTTVLRRSEAEALSLEHPSYWEQEGAEGDEAEYAARPRRVAKRIRDLRLARKPSSGRRVVALVQTTHVGLAVLRSQSGAEYSLDAIGGLQPRDIGKRIYLMNGELQIENEEQFSHRLQRLLAGTPVQRALIISPPICQFKDQVLVELYCAVGERLTCAVRRYLPSRREAQGWAEHYFKPLTILPTQEE